MKRHLSFASIVAGLAILTLTFGATLLDGGTNASADRAAPVTREQSQARTAEYRFWSPALGKDMPYEVYLPPGYDSHPDARYPVLYMLHSLGGNYKDWEKVGLFAAATELMASGEIEPMIIVTPEGERGYWIDQANNGPRFGTYVARDLVARIDADYRTLPQTSFRGIGGMSMGGHGALQLALNNPGEFAVVGAHSVALRRKEEAFDFFGDRQYFEAHDPVSLMKKNEAQARGLVIWVDMGDKDLWYGPAKSFHEQLQSEKIPHSWTVFPGAHDIDYWRAHVSDYLRFYGHAFERTGEMLLASQS